MYTSVYSIHHDHGMIVFVLLCILLHGRSVNIVGLDYDPICAVSDPAMERFKQACVPSLCCKPPRISKGIMAKKRKDNQF